MGKHVFICHSTQDKLIAEEVCKALESRDIRCWIAPRDIPPGAEWAEAIIDAVDGSSVVILVLSSSSNSSPQVIREIGRAVSKDVPIIPFRIDDTPLSKSMEYFLSTHQWLDALGPPLERHFQKLADTVQRLLAREAARAKKKAEERAKEKAARVKVPAGAGKRITKSIWLWAVVALVVVGLGIAGLFTFMPTVAPPASEPAEESAPASEPAPIIWERGGSISGKVIADASLDGISSLYVCAADYLTNEWIAGASTGADGTYTLEGLPAGTYKVKAEPAQYLHLPYAAEYYDNTYDFWAAQEVRVSTGQEITGINFSLAPGGNVSGTVRNADGSAPLANVSVECYRIVNGVWESWCATTDSNGDYTIYSVPYGEFGARAPAGGKHGSGDDDFVQEYYNDKSREGQANRVIVASGVSPSDVNFTLEVGGSISGKVIADASLDGIASLHVDVWDYDTGEWMSCAETGGDGTYTLHGLPAGTYRVGVNPSLNKLPYVGEYYDNTTNHSAAQRVTVSVGEDTPGINFSLASTAP